MTPISFPGSREIGKPKSMTEEECSSIQAANGTDDSGFPFWLTAWKPSKEDLDALNRGEPVYVKTLSNGLPPMVLFTIDESGTPNV